MLSLSLSDSKTPLLLTLFFCWKIITHLPLLPLMLYTTSIKSTNGMIQMITNTYYCIKNPNYC